MRIKLFFLFYLASQLHLSGLDPYLGGVMKLQIEVRKSEACLESGDIASIYSNELHAIMEWMDNNTSGIEKQIREEFEAGAEVSVNQLKCELKGIIKEAMHRGLEITVKDWPTVLSIEDLKEILKAIKTIEKEKFLH